MSDPDPKAWNLGETQRVAVVVAHPDDETLWTGGLLLSHPEWSIFIVSLCRGKDTDPTASFCTGYIMGEFDALSLARKICPSASGASTLGAVAAARKYIRTHREAWDSAPAFVVRTALQAAFPCKRK